MYVHQPVEETQRATGTYRHLQADCPLQLQVTGFAQMELNEIRPFFTLAFKRLLQLDPQEAERQEAAPDDAADEADDLDQDTDDEGDRAGNGTGNGGGMFDD